MNPYQKDVRDFMDAMGQDGPAAPSLEGYPFELRSRLILEEALEFIKAAGCRVRWKGTDLGAALLPDVHPADLHIVALTPGAEKHADWPEMIDALQDLLYVVFGAMVAMGLDSDVFFQEVHGSNMSKLGPDGKPLRREDGKIIKPAGWQPPNIAELLAVELRAHEMTLPEARRIMDLWSKNYGPAERPTPVLLETLGVSWRDWKAAHRKWQ